MYAYPFGVLTRWTMDVCDEGALEDCWIHSSRVTNLKTILPLDASAG